MRGTFLASPPLVVAYAIAGSILHDLTRDKLGDDAEGKPVFLADIWPSDAEIRAHLDRALTDDLFRARLRHARRSRTGMERHSATAQAPVFAWNPRQHVPAPPAFPGRPGAA